MPRDTHAYPFEMKVVLSLGELLARLTNGTALRSFLIILTRDGNVLSLGFKDDSPNWHERVWELRDSGTPHLFYDRLDDGMEYVFLSWQGIERSVMERLLNKRFEEADFLPYPHFAYRAQELVPEKQFPQSWGVMF